MKKAVYLIGLIVAFCFAQTGAKYLIITHDNFYGAIQPIAEWKHQKGIPTKIVKLSEFNAAPESLSRIKNYIVNAYNTWTPRPDYVLLVGSPDYIRTDQNQFDDYYANMTGNYLMEISIGRFSCSNASECSVLVRKTLGYEQTPYLQDTSWFKKGTGIIREDISLSDTIYWQNMRYIFGLWQGAGYNQIDSFSRLYGDSARHVEQAITDGRAFVGFRGQGVNNWWDPFAINPALTSNGYKLPIIISGTCATISLEPAISYLGEACVRAGSIESPKGAVAFFGTTNSTSGTGIGILRGTVVTSLFKSIFTEQTYKLGDACRRAKFLIDSIRPVGYSSTRYREWNLLGDPELNIWTSVPKTLSVQCETLIQTGQQNYAVSVRYGANPVPNALVCIMKDTTIYQYGYTNSSGTVSFSINPQSIGTMLLTVTTRNAHPLEKNIRVRSVNIEEIVNYESEMGRLSVYPNPVRHVFYIPGLVNTKNIELYDVQGRNISKNYLRITHQAIHTAVDVSNLSLGVYMIVVNSNQQKFFGKIIKRG